MQASADNSPDLPVPNNEAEASMNRLAKNCLDAGFLRWNAAIRSSMFNALIVALLMSWILRNDGILALLLRPWWQEALIVFLFVWPWSIALGVLLYPLRRRYKISEWASFVGTVSLGLVLGGVSGWVAAPFEAYINIDFWFATIFTLIFAALSFASNLVKGDELGEWPVWAKVIIVNWVGMLRISATYILIGIGLSLWLFTEQYWLLSEQVILTTNLFVLWPWAIVIALLTYRLSVALNDRWIALPISFVSIAVVMTDFFVDEAIPNFAPVTLTIVAVYGTQGWLMQHWRRETA